MGSRANVVVHDDVDESKVVYLYTHWGEEELEAEVAKALHRGRERWGDAPYIARIIFCEMVRDDLDSPTGYGISAVPYDGEEIHVYPKTREVVGYDGRRVSMDEFIGSHLPSTSKSWEP